MVDDIKDIRMCYRKTFAGEIAKYVIEDLKLVCFHRGTTVVRDSNMNVDEKAMLMNEGRRQVYIHIQNMLAEIDDDFKIDEGEEDYGY